MKGEGCRVPIFLKIQGFLLPETSECLLFPSTSGSGQYGKHISNLSSNDRSVVLCAINKENPRNGDSDSMKVKGKNHSMR